MNFPEHYKRHELGPLVGMMGGGTGEVKCNLIRRPITTTSKRRRRLQSTVIYNSDCQLAKKSKGKPAAASSAHTQLQPIDHHRRQRQCHQSTKSTSAATLFNKSQKTAKGGQTNKRSSLLPLTFRNIFLCFAFLLLSSHPSPSSVQGNIRSRWFSINSVSIGNRKEQNYTPSINFVCLLASLSKILAN